MYYNVWTSLWHVLGRAIRFSMKPGENSATQGIWENFDSILISHNSWLEHFPYFFKKFHFKETNDNSLQQKSANSIQYGSVFTMFLENRVSVEDSCTGNRWRFLHRSEMFTEQALFQINLQIFLLHNALLSYSKHSPQFRWDVFNMPLR